MTTSSEEEQKAFELFTTKDLPYGKPFYHWTKEWWKWILQIPASKNPAYGYAGTGGYHEAPYADPYQPPDRDQVWFLAGAFNDGTLPIGSHNIVYRYVMGIPSDKALLLPVINFFGVTRSKDPKDAEELNKKVKEEMDIINPGSLYVTIDKQQVPDLMRYRAATADTHDEPFRIKVNGKDNVVKMKHLLGRPIELLAKGDGYWVFLKPLPPGQHEIHSFGSCLQGKIQIEVHYKLDVIDNIPS